MKFVVVYATNSKIMRRVLVSDDIGFVANAAPGESVLDIAPEVYAQFKGPQDVIAHLVNAVGAPLHSGRCVELDARGQVTGVFMADPAIDPPVRGGSLEINDRASPGDVKLVGTGEFVSMQPIVPINRAQEILAVQQAFGSSLQEATAAVDAEIVQQQALLAKQAQASAQIGVIVNPGTP